MLLFVKKIVKHVINFFEVISGLLGISLVLIVLLQIILRVFFSRPIAWVFELSSIFLVYSVFLGAIVLIESDRAAQVSIILERLPKSLQWVLRNIFAVLTGSVGVLMFIGGVAYWEFLGRYSLSNLPLSARVFIFPVYLFALSLVWKGLTSIHRYPGSVPQKGEAK